MKMLYSSIQDEDAAKFLPFYLFFHFFCPEPRWPGSHFSFDRAITYSFHTNAFCHGNTY